MRDRRRLHAGAGRGGADPRLINRGDRFKIEAHVSRFYEGCKGVGALRKDAELEPGVCSACCETGERRGWCWSTVSVRGSTSPQSCRISRLSSDLGGAVVHRGPGGATPDRSLRA